MYKLDIKDRKILYELDLNCRQSNAQIGKKVGLKRDVVTYRIKKLEENGIIKNYWTLIDTFRLGYDVFRVYINFQYVSSHLKNEIIQYFIDYPNSWVVVSEKSEIDLDVVIWVKDIFEFYRFWDITLDKYEDYFENYSISIYIQGIVYKKSYLLFTDHDKSNREIGRLTCGGESISIDKIDYKLLNELAVNARSPLVELAKKMECSSQSINYRIKNLVKSGIIKAFRVDIDLSKLGLKRFKIDIYLKDHKLKKPVFNYLISKPYLEFMNLAIGWADLEPEFVVKKFDRLYKILEDIDSEFPGAIKKQSFFITDTVYKLRCLPEIKNF
jgi:DNA-binding Lrp family transcriptional regulator